jgi:hypothetical protein
VCVSSRCAANPADNKIYAFTVLTGTAIPTVTPAVTPTAISTTTPTLRVTRMPTVKLTLQAAHVGN